LYGVQTQRGALVKEALKRDLTIREVAVEKAKAGALKHSDQGRPVTVEEVEATLNDLRRLTEDGITGG
jgi:predicted transcriptional regulator